MKSLEWLSGLLEGEGCFTYQRSGTGVYRTPLVALGMTDHDVVDGAREVFERLGNRICRLHRRRLPSGKIAFDLRVTGLPAAQIMYAVLPYLGIRRAAKVREILAAWKPIKYQEIVRAFAQKGVFGGGTYRLFFGARPREK